RQLLEDEPGPALDSPQAVPQGRSPPCIDRGRFLADRITFLPPLPLVRGSRSARFSRLEKIGQAFRAHLPDHLKAVQDALRERDAPRLREAAHKLAGMLAAFSTTAGGVASEVEDH